MAVNYHKGMDDLLVELRRNGLHPSVLKKSGEKRPLAAEIAVKGGLVVHWDRDSRSLWAEGPWPDTARLEARLNRLRRGNKFQRTAQKPSVIAGVLAAVAMLAASYFAAVRAPTPELQETTRPVPAVEEPLFADGRAFP